MDEIQALHGDYTKKDRYVGPTDRRQNAFEKIILKRRFFDDKEMGGYWRLWSWRKIPPPTPGG